MPKTPPKPALSLVSSETTIAASPPRDLGRHGHELWNAIQTEYAIIDRGGIELLAQACAAADRAEALAEAIERDGSVVYSESGAPRSHPAIKDELNARALVVRTLERLGVTVERVKPVGRPPGKYGWTGGT